jgi:amino acid adenylation domain-containing protein
MEGIAVVGIAGRFPGAADCAEFWRNLIAGEESLRVFSLDEIYAAGVRPEEVTQKRVRARGVVPGAEEFDAAFFGYSPKEAEILDPQHRVFLEVAWEALESAGFDPDRPPGSVGVFAGSGINSYYAYNILTRPDVLGRFGVFPAVLLNEKDFLATRLSYKLNLRGPAVTVQTACSTSLVAICQACQSLMSYDCDLALAGGVALVFPQSHSRIHEEGGMISPDGHCRPFSADANGTLFSDGVGVVALRRLEDALESGDNVLAVIKGFATNNDGADKAGFTAPSVNGQARVIRMAQALGDIDPATINYVEAHGTATPLGDPIEIAALTKAFRAKTKATQYCAIGSVKSNIGHLDVAAGVAGLIKTVLALQHRQIPPTINYREPNPHIDFANSPFFVADQLLDWRAPSAGARRAAVSSFGVGGTNAHVVLEEAPPREASTPDPRPQVIVLSGRTAKAVEAQSSRLGEMLAGDSRLPLADVAFTLQTGRRQFPVRRALVVRDTAELLERLQPGQLARSPVQTAVKSDPPVVFMFPGQGAQRINMGREYYEGSDLFRELVDYCAAALEPELGLDLRAVLYPPAGSETQAEQLIVQTRITQPALFVTEYALAKLWMSWGVRPAAMIGHSVGEYAAACLSGVFSLDDALKLIAARGRLIQQQPPGTMLIVMEAAAEIADLIGGEISLAAINAPRLCVISGPEPAIRACEEVLAERKVTTRRLQTSHAFHSSMMQGALAPFAKVLADVTLSAPQIPYPSNVSGDWITDEQTQSPEYWTSHLRQGVNFSGGISTLLQNPDYVFIEVGPGGTLTSLGTMHSSRDMPTTFIASAAARAEPGGEWTALLGALGKLWQAGVTPDWNALHGGATRHRVALPTYPFERSRYLVEPGASYGQGPGARVQEAQAPAVAAVASVGSEGPVAQRKIREIVASLSGVDASKEDGGRTFLEMGFDSLFLSQFARSIEIDFGISVTYRELTDELNTFDKLSAHVEANAVRGVAPAAAATAPPTSAHAAAGVAAAALPPAAPPAAGLAEVLARLVELERKIDRLGDSRSRPPATERSLPMTEAQREIWLACQLSDDASRTYNESFLIALRGPLDLARLQAALQRLVDDHDALRTVLHPDGSGQRIRATQPVELAVEELPGATDDRARLVERAQAIRDELFDLVEGPLYRFRLFRLNSDDHVLLIAAHHLAVDGWSWQVLLSELGARYAAALSGIEPTAPVAMQYEDYARWAESAAHRDRIARDERFWLERLADRPAEVDLPFERRRGAKKSFVAGHVRQALSVDEATMLRELARRLDCTLFHVLLASYAAWAHRVTGRESIVIGVPMAGQGSDSLVRHDGVRSLVGHCVNLLPVRVDVAATSSFAELSRHVKDQMGLAREHQNVSLGALLEKLRWPMDPARLPMVSVSLNMVRKPDADFGSEVRAAVESLPKNYSYFDMTVDVFDDKGQLALDCKFDAELLSEATAHRWLEQWRRLMASASSDANTEVGALELLSAVESKRLLDWGRGRPVDLPAVRTVHGLVEACARAHPERTAVIFGSERVTYRELDARATALAARLRQRGVGRGTLVGVCLRRSNRLVEALLAVLKAGAGYVPIDPTYPPDRIRHVVEDSGAVVVLTETATQAAAAGGRAEQLVLDAAENLSRSASVGAQADAAGESDLAYVIYTSGSTGKPKGVQIEHRSVVSFLQSMRERPGLDSGDRLLAVTTISFDIAGLELFLPLTTGATVVIAPAEAVLDGLELAALIGAHDVSVMQATPATWRLLLESGWTGKADLRVLCGGEPLPEDLVRRLLPKVGSIWNMYGPTETTIWSTCSRVEAAADIHIGTPIDNTLVRVVDARGNLVPIGVSGELLLGGVGVARGYLNRPELNAERFVTLPAESGRFYRTGDLARVRTDGNLDCLGRLDFQVKIRGFRVEIGEIEAVLSADSAVDQAVVVARPDASGTVALVAYIRLNERQGSNLAQVRDRARRFLPDYMIPAYMIETSEYPLTPNGKIDRKALEARPLDTPATREIVAPRTRAEQAVANLFQEILGAGVVSATDNFFDLGGHSIAAARLMSRLRSDLAVTVPLRTLFETPTVAGIAGFIEQSAPKWKSPSLPQAADREEFEI